MTHMKNEIERKFLINEPPLNLEDCTAYDIRQGYMHVSENMEIRIRRKGDQHFQAVKLGTGLNRHEVENEIGQLQFEELWPDTEGRHVEKTRYEIPYENLVIELDIYEGDLKGLITAEVEFESEDQSARFTPPTWFGPEITHDERYKNKNLALDGLPE